MSVVRPFEESFERLVQAGLGLGVQRRGRLVQESPPSDPEKHHAGDGDTLALTAGESHALASDDRVEAVGQGGHVVADLRHLEGGPERCVIERASQGSDWCARCR